MKAKGLLLVPAIAAVVAAVGWWCAAPARPDVDGAEAMSMPPRISPDYSGIVLPPNIAPLNFVVREPGQRFFVRMVAEAGDPIEIVSRSPQILIPPRPWRAFLEANRGKDVQWEVCVEASSGWQRYRPIVNHVAEEEIDGYLVYRMVGPIHNKWRRTAIHQRDLASYDSRPVIEGGGLDGGCVNCHSFAANAPTPMLIGIRGQKSGKATLLAEGGAVTKLASPIGYTAWHPSGRVAAYSVNKVRQFFHAAGPDVRDVVDLDSGLACLRVETKKSRRVPGATGSDRLETYPAWSPDGRYLYYSSAPLLWTDRDAWPPARYDEVKYDLRRIRYDFDADRWGEPETVLSAEKTGSSILLPRISPDGKHLLFCMCRYGAFPVFHSSSDLYLMDLAGGAYRKLEINSEFSESYHCWASNSRWIAFSSRRQGGVFTRCYFSFVDQAGRAHKPFVLPQQDPEFYDSLLQSICVPELITGPVEVSQADLIRAAQSGGAVPIDAPSATPQKPEELEPWQQSGR